MANTKQHERAVKRARAKHGDAAQVWLRSPERVRKILSRYGMLSGAIHGPSLVDRNIAVKIHAEFASDIGPLEVELKVALENIFGKAVIVEGATNIAELITHKHWTRI
jgi:hypothetical protein